MNVQSFANGAPLTVPSKNTWNTAPEGAGPSARHMRFGDMAEVEARTQELTNLVVAWCDMMSPRVRKYTKKAKPPA